MDVASYHSVGVDTAMLYNGTTLNKAVRQRVQWSGV